MRRLFLCSVLAASLLPSVAQAGPWTREVGGRYLKLWTGGTIGFGFSGTDADPGVRFAGPYGNLELGLYGEVGLTPWLTLSWNQRVLELFGLNLAEAAVESGAGRYSAISAGDPTFGAVIGGWQAGPVVMGIEAELTVPIQGERTLARARLVDAPQEVELRLSNGLFEGRLAWAMGGSFTTRKGGAGYAFGSLGWRIRGRPGAPDGDLADRLSFALGLGLPMGARGRLGFRLYGDIRVSTRPALTLPDWAARGDAHNGIIGNIEWSRALTEHDWLSVALGFGTWARGFAAGPVILVSWSRESPPAQRP